MCFCSKRKNRLLVALLSLSLFTGCTGKNDTPLVELEEPYIQSRTLHTAEYRTLSINSYYEGRMEADHETIKAPVAGEVKGLSLSLGDEILPGDLICRIVDSAGQKSLSDAEEKLSACEREIIAAEKTHEEKLALLTSEQETYALLGKNYESQLTSLEIEEENLTYSRDKKEREAKLSSLQETIDALSEKTYSSEIRAQKGGVVAGVSYGGTVKKNDDLVVIANAGEILFRADTYLSDSYLSEAVSVTLLTEEGETEVIPKPYDAITYQKLSAQNNLKSSYFSLKEEYSCLVSGSYGILKVCEKEKERALCIPKACLKGREGHYTVYKENEGQSILVPVETGLTDGLFVEILSGVSEGDRVYQNEQVAIGLSKQKEMEKEDVEVWESVSLKRLWDKVTELCYRNDYAELVFDHYEKETGTYVIAGEPVAILHLSYREEEIEKLKNRVTELEAELTEGEEKRQELIDLALMASHYAKGEEQKAIQADWYRLVEEKHSFRTGIEEELSRIMAVLYEYEQYQLEGEKKILAPASGKMKITENSQNTFSLTVETGTLPYYVPELSGTVLFWGQEAAIKGSNDEDGVRKDLSGCIIRGNDLWKDSVLFAVTSKVSADELRDKATAVFKKAALKGVLSLKSSQYLVEKDSQNQQQYYVWVSEGQTVVKRQVLPQAFIKNGTETIMIVADGLSEKDVIWYE